MPFYILQSLQVVFFKFEYIFDADGFLGQYLDFKYNEEYLEIRNHSTDNTIFIQIK